MTEQSIFRQLEYLNTTSARPDLTRIIKLYVDLIQTGVHTKQSGYKTYTLPTSGLNSHIYSFFLKYHKMIEKIPLTFKYNSN